MTKIMQVFFITLSALVGLIFISMVRELVGHWVGHFLALFLWLLAVPVLSPAVFILPWFGAWVTGSEVNQHSSIFWIWAVWMGSTVVAVVMSGYFAFKNR